MFRTGCLALLILTGAACGGPAMDPTGRDSGSTDAAADTTPDSASVVDVADAAPDSAADAVSDDGSNATDVAPDTMPDVSQDVAVTCLSGQTTCGNRCVVTATDPMHCGGCDNACPAGQLCAMGRCMLTCPAGLTVCGSACASLQNDPMNCGACGTACPIPTGGGTAVCASGRCGVSCPTGFTACGNACVNLATDGANCGACGTACPSGQTCSGSRCVTGCPTGQMMCGGACVDVASSDTNCGACGRACATDQVCTAGLCGPRPCPSGQMRCGTACVDTSNAVNNCGACGRVCPTPSGGGTATCTAGVCGVSCPTGLTNCSGACLDLSTNRNNCGACGRTCASGEICTGSACQPLIAPCVLPSVRCGSACVNMTNDVSNCGMCGRVCNLANANPMCASSTCQVASCMPGFGNCDGVHENGCETGLGTDANNCGACGRVCTGGQICSAGACACPTGMALCGSVCVNAMNDLRNCGACGTVCPIPSGGTAVCSAGRCGTGACSAGMTLCGSTCVSTTGDAMNCGACGRACNLPNATATCATGACMVTTCNPGFADCDRDASNGCEVNTMTNGANCGACGTMCAPGRVCNRGACELVCNGGLTACGSDCTDTNTATNNCGRCGNVCPVRPNTTSTCVGGACGMQCNTGFGDCDRLVDTGCEVELRRRDGDVLNCGACGNVCITGPHAVPMCRFGFCGIASCETGYADCDGNVTNGCEVNLATNASNCGACGTACASPIAGRGACVAGTCRYTCDDSFGTVCGTSYCANLSSDRSNCGACGNRCNLANTAFHYCARGTCYPDTCTTGFGDCDLWSSNGCEADLRADANNCGACGRACPGGWTCRAGACVSPCTGSQVLCGGTCRDTSTDVNNCGSCGTVCVTGQSCSGGRCMCPSGQTLCGTACVDTNTSTTNCGACGRSCSAGQTCSGGVCTTTSCPTGQNICGGVCRDTLTDNNNCGTCGTVCPSGQTCQSGTCRSSSGCPSGYTNCGGSCIDVSNNVMNCGRCGNNCAGGEICSAGACVAPTCTGGRPVTFALPRAAFDLCRARGGRLRTVTWGRTVGEFPTLPPGISMRVIRDPGGVQTPMYLTDADAPGFTFTSTSPTWAAGNFLDITGICVMADTSEVYLEEVGFWAGYPSGFWAGFTTLERAQGSATINGAQVSGTVPVVARTPPPGTSGVVTYKPRLTLLGC